jgi:hypothetical protein
MVEIKVTDTGSCLTGLTLNQTNNNHPNAPAGIQTGKYWSITPAGCTIGFTVNLTMPHAISPQSNARLCRYDTGSSTWDCDAAGSNSSVTATTVTRSAVSQFSDWSVGDVSQPLAVNLAKFAATSEGEQLSVRWQTINELDNLGFNLYRSPASVPASVPPNSGATADGWGRNDTTQ